VRERFEESWALWSILAAQATLTLPWLWRTAAFADEAEYLSAAHQGWSHLPAFANQFPGLPVLYPPIAATFDSAGRFVDGSSGGLFAARLLSVVFMLAATAMVYLIGDRLFGRIPGVLAALLIAVCGIVVHLGAAATFDPMALFLLVLALYAAVRMRDGPVRWLLLCPIALAAANATKYSTAAFDPVIIGTIILYGWSKGRFQSIFLALSVAVTTAVIDLGILILGGDNLATGVLSNTLYASLESGVPSSSLSVLGHAVLMTGLIVLIAIAGVCASVVKKMPVTAIAFLCLLVLAALLAPIEQARIHELTSLDENMGFGLPFAALAAGYALGAWRQWLGRQRHWGKVVATTAAVITVITMLLVGRVERVQFRGPGAGVASSVLSVVGKHWVQGTYVLDESTTSTTDQYYLPMIPQDRWIRVYKSTLDQAQQRISDRCASIVVLVAKYGAVNGAVRRTLRQTNFHPMPPIGVSPNQVTVWVAGPSGVQTTQSEAGGAGQQKQSGGACA
jgi:hypothetical protein